MPPLKFLLVASMVLLLSACAVFRGDGSWADGASDKDAGQLAAQIADLVAERVPAGDRIRLAAPTANAVNAAVAAQLPAALHMRGLALAEEGAPVRPAHTLRFFVSRYGDGLSLHLHIDDVEATTLLIRGQNGELVAGAPLTLRKVTP